VLAHSPTLWQYLQSAAYVYFTVTPNGDVSFDSSLDGILSVQNNTTLIVNGVTITVDATRLSDPYVQIASTTESTSAPFSLAVLPGTQTLQQYQDSATALNFTVAPNGDVSFASSLDGILSVQNNTTLIVNGVMITVNATALSDPYVQIASTTETTTAPFFLTVLPGTQTLQEYQQSGTSLNFMIADNGDVSFLSSLDGILSAQGSTLVVNGETLIINATAISSTVSSFSIGAFANLSTAQVQTLQVLPGTVLFSDSTLQFNVTLATTDQLSYPADVDTEVSGSGTNTLVILF
jgi:hypothetical protein